MSTVEIKPEAHSRNKRPVVLAVAAAAVALILGIVIGATINSHSAQIASLQAKTRSLRSQLVTANQTAAQARSQAAQAQGQASQARTAAANAQASAQAHARAQYAAKMAQANRLLRKLQKEQGVVQSSTISADGVYVVGKDIPSGVYHTSGGGQCYYATLNSTNTSDISDNNNFNGPETVDVSGAYAFQIQGGCTWVKE